MTIHPSDGSAPGYIRGILLPTSRTRRVLRWARRLALALLLPLLLLAGLTQWWLLPRLNDYRDDLAEVLGHYLQLPVQIETVTAAIEGWRLALRLQGVSIHDPERDATLARFTRASVTLNLWRSFRDWRLVVGRIRLEGASLTLAPRPDGASRWPTDAALPEAAHWLFDLRGLDIMGEQLAVRLPNGAALQLLHPYLHLRQSMQGQQLSLTADLPTPLGERLEMTVERSSVVAGWRLQGQVHFKNQSSQRWPPMVFEVAPTAAGWQATIRHWRAENLLDWAKPWLGESARQWLTPLNLQGELPEIGVRLESDAETYTVTAALREINTRPVHGLPGFKNVTGQLQFTAEEGRIELDSRAVQVDTAGLLRAPITLNTLKGLVEWRREADRLRLDSAGLELANHDLNGRFWGRVIVPDTGGPWLDIQGRYHDVKVSRARHYLPVAVIPPEGVAWLDQALVSGRVMTGEMTFRGPPAAFPFDRNEGLFETRFQVEDAVLDYGPGWPRLERLKTNVLFRNRGLTVEADQGRLLDGELENATVRIDDLSEVVVQVKGRAKGPAASMWRVLKDSPLGKELGDDLPDLQATGVGTLDLELALPTDTRPSQARGRVELLDNDLTLPAWTIALERLRGEVRFTENDLNARNVQARLRGEPVRLDLELAGREGRRELRTQVRGRLGLPALAGESAMALETRITGKSDWKAVVTVPTGSGRRSGRPAFILDVHSDLRGMALDWPEPFAKPASESQSLRIMAQPVAADQLTVKVDYGEDTQAVLALRGPIHALQLERGELRIGAGAAKLPDQPGLAVVARLPRWAWTTSPMQISSLRKPGINPLKLIRNLDARIGELTLAGQTFPAITVNGARYAEGLRIDLDSPTLVGRLTVPDEPTPQHPVNAALQRLHLRYVKSPVSRKIQSDPRQAPPLVFTVAGLRVNDRNLGRLRFVAMPHAQGIHLSDIELSSERQRIEASGGWQWNGPAQTSRIKATLYSAALGETLADLGYPDAGVARGETQVEGAVEWVGALPDFALEHLSGALKFQIGPGQLLEINPGLGRMIGLFNVQNLTRRLSLDFSDLFQPGASFDRITGDWSFDDGQARTDNLTIEAPAARVDVQGRVGLKDRDYDQRITVTPRLGGTLPIAGALAGGPVTGAAVFVAERLLQKGIEQATRYHYRLRGSWDDPVLEPLIEETPHTAPRQGFTSDN